MKTVLRLIVSLAICAVIYPQILWAMTNIEYINWWNDYRNKENIPSELKEMEDYFVNSNLINYSSYFWNTLNRLNIEQIVSKGYENFKQTVTRNYFTWVVSLDHPYALNLKNAVPKLLVSLPPKELYKIHPLWSAEESYQFNSITLYFLNYMLQLGAGPYLEKLEEPLIGNPPFLTYKGRRVSQDIFNSLLEYIPVSKNCPIEKISTIIEIGAGSGRTAFCYLSLLPNIKYIIVDFPPALYVSQKYLSDVFPEKKVMKFRPFSQFSDIATEYAESNIVFLTPDQLPLLPDESADLFLAIDCLHEMKPEIISHYFNEAQRLCSYFYYKCWENTTIPYDNITLTEKSYPVDPLWQLIFNENCFVPSGFFHAFYRMK